LLGLIEGCLKDFTSAGGVDVLSLGGYFAVTEVLNDFKNFGPSWEGALVDSFVFVDGHDEFEEFAGDFPLFRRPADLTPPPARPSSPIHARSAFYDITTFLMLCPTIRQTGLLLHHPPSIGTGGVAIQ